MPASAEGLLTALALAVGAVLGSFLNVVIARVPAGQSIVAPGSRCPRCATPIAWYDNVPVISWLLLRARCRACQAPISARYPLVELLGAAAALLALRRHGLSWETPAELAFALLLLALAFIDLDTWLLPNALTWPLLGAGLLLAVPGVTAAPSLASAASGAGVGFGAFAAIAAVGKRLAGREAMGFGDVWLLGGIGAWLGLAALLPVVLLASLQGTVVGLLLGVLGKLPTGEAKASSTPTPTSTSTSTGDPKEEEDWVPPRNAVPFGPFLVLGALEWLYLGDAIVRVVPTLEVFR